MDDAQNPFPLHADQRQARRADPFGAQPAFQHRELDVLHEFRVRVEMQQRREPAVNLARLVPFASAREFPKILVLARESEADARDPAVNAEDRRF